MTYSGEMNTEISSADIEFELSLNVSKNMLNLIQMFYLIG